MKIFDLYYQYSDADKEWTMLEKLRDAAIMRTEQAFKRISEVFLDGAEDIYRDLTQSKILSLYESDPESNVYWVKGTSIDIVPDHQFLIVVHDLKKRHPKLFVEPARIVIEVLVDSNYPQDHLLGDIRSAKSLFDSSEVYVVVKRDMNCQDKGIQGGVAIKLEYAPDKENDEMVLEGVSSNDMASFIRKVISVYVEHNPDITLSRLQYDLRRLHSGSKWEFVESKEKIQQLKDKGERVYYSFKEIGKLPNGEEYVVYKELLRRKHLPLIIEFAKEHNIL